MKERPLLYNYLRTLSTCCLLGIAFLLHSQKVITIQDPDGTPLIGVEVYTEDLLFGTTTDRNGSAEISASFQDHELYFRYLGYKDFVKNMSTIESGSILTMIPEQKILDEVVLIGRSDIRERDFLQQVEAINASEIARMNTQTAADALSKNAEVFVQKSQMGGGSPVIRGFEANKVLLVVDGVRMNNAIYRSGHLQNAITIDQAILDQMEVIYGPSALMYGSDALGGVIHFRTKDPILNLSKVKKVNAFGNYYARYGSANNERSGHFDINIGGRKLASLSSITYSNFGDLRMGSRRSEKYPEFGLRSRYQSRQNQEDIILDNPNPNLQIGTQYNQFDILQKVKYQVHDNLSIIGNYQYSTSSNIPRYDQLILENDGVFSFAEWEYGPQNRSLYSLKIDWKGDKFWQDEFIFLASVQDIRESRITRLFGSDIRTNNTEDVMVYSATLDAKKEWILDQKHAFYYGLDVHTNQVSSMVENKDIITGVPLEGAFTRYPSGGSTMDLAGAYAQYIWQKLDTTITLHGGLRWSYVRTHVDFDRSDAFNWPAYFYDGISAENNSVNWSIGANYRPDQKTTIRWAASSAFRAPNVDDIGKLRIKGANLSIPNADLTPEKSINTELNIHRQVTSSLDVGVSGFFTLLSDAIIRTDFTLPDGSTMYNDGTSSYTIQSNINAERARVMGVSSNLSYSLSTHWKWTSSINYIKGRVIEPEENPLAHIPPLYGRNTLRYRKGNLEFDFVHSYNGRKQLIEYGGSPDNPEYATEEGALAWSTYSIYGNYTYRDYTFQLGVENILDKHYVPFASGVSAPGINAIVAVRGRF